MAEGRTPIAEFLRRVRTALGKVASDSPPDPYPLLAQAREEVQQRAEELQRYLESRRPHLLNALADLAPRRGWKVFRAASPDEAGEYLSRLASDRGAQTVVHTLQPVFDLVPPARWLEGKGVRVVPLSAQTGLAPAEMRELARRADIGVTGADFATAETATVVLTTRRGVSRLASLAPPVHVAIVRPEDVVEKLEDVFLLKRLDYLSGRERFGTYMNFITGPSRTADIEQTIVVGVHGPGEAHMVLLG